MKRTKQQRLRAVIDHYRDLVRRAWTMDELTNWVMSHKLWPVPGARDPEAIGAEWDRRFDAAIKLPRACRECGCTDDDCQRCIAKTGRPCHWVEGNLCSACMPGEASHG